MQGKLVCVGNGERLTMPVAQGYYGGRAYRFAPLGVVYHYVAGAATPTIGTCDSRYGLVIVDDFTYEEPRGSRVDLSWEGSETRVVYGHADSHADIAKHGMGRVDDLAMQWKKYGAVRIDGDLPTDEQIQQGADARRAHATQVLNDAIRGQNIRRQGGKGFGPGFSKADRQWAKEYCVKLEESLEILAKDDPVRKQYDVPQTVEAERVPCPKCAEMILPQAMKCRYCGANFKTSVIDQITQPVAQEVAS